MVVSTLDRGRDAVNVRPPDTERLVSMRNQYISRPLSAQVRFWAKVDKSGECWLWTGAKNQKGYGRFRFNGQVIYAHRWVYEDAFGPIPDGLELDHLCRTTSCVRPAHVEAVPHRTNILRGLSPAAQNAQKEECRYGHSLSNGNLYLRRDGKRSCRLCKSRLSREHWQRKKALCAG
jgi:hypothetical protein